MVDKIENPSDIIQRVIEDLHRLPPEQQVLAVTYGLNNLRNSIEGFPTSQELMEALSALYYTIDEILSKKSDELATTIGESESYNIHISNLIEEFNKIFNEKYENFTEPKSSYFKGHGCFNIIGGFKITFSEIENQTKIYCEQHDLNKINTDLIINNIKVFYNDNGYVVEEGFDKGNEKYLFFRKKEKAEGNDQSAS